MTQHSFWARPMSTHWTHRNSTSHHRAREAAINIPILQMGKLRLSQKLRGPALLMLKLKKVAHLVSQ